MSSVVLVGSPNSGKSLLFNRLTGLNQKVANYPGITVDVREGGLQGGDGAKVLDFPGTYSLQPVSGEEKVAVDNFDRLLAGDELAAVLCIVDATRLTKSLSFALQVARAAERAGRPVLLVANMIDVLEAHDVSFDADGLAEALAPRDSGLRAHWRRYRRCAGRRSPLPKMRRPAKLAEWMMGAAAQR